MIRNTATGKTIILIISYSLTCSPRQCCPLMVCFSFCQLAQPLMLTLAIVNCPSLTPSHSLIKVLANNRALFKMLVILLIVSLIYMYYASLLKELLDNGKA